MNRLVVIAVACLPLMALTACGPRAAGPSAERAERPATVAAPPPAAAALDEGALLAPGRVALRYALAARTWTSRTYRAQYRRQLALSTGPLHRALQQAPPTGVQLAAYRAEAAEASATATAVTRLFTSATQARYRVLLDERSSAAGQAAAQRAAYLVELRRYGGGWLVSAFTIQP